MGKGLSRAGEIELADESGPDKVAVEEVDESRDEIGTTTVVSGVAVASKLGRWRLVVVFPSAWIVVEAGGTSKRS